VAHMLEYPLENGGSILVAVEAESGPVTRGWGEDRSRQIAERATETFEAAVSKVRSAADAMLTSLSGLNSTPDDITVEFAIQLNAEAGVCIATLGSSANFKIALKWKPSRAMEAGRDDQWPATTTSPQE
jgi:Trypsin-co-occurring domain 1